MTDNSSTPASASPSPTPSQPAVVSPLPARNVKLVIAYDGTAYHGWQRQAGLPATVQQVVEEALGRVIRHPVAVSAAGRTDAGVHAEGQVAAFRTDCRIPAGRLAGAVNARLPADIRIRRAADVVLPFHPTHWAAGKLYRYTLFTGGIAPAAGAGRVWHWHRGADVPAMAEAARRLLGRHDFTSFESTGSPRRDKVRTLSRFEVFREGDLVHCDLSADGFLYNMVRNLVGTVVEVGRGARRPGWVDEVLAARDRRAAGPLAPASGLCLRWVRYPPGHELESPEPADGVSRPTEPGSASGTPA